MFSEVNVPPVVFDGDTLSIAGASMYFSWVSSNPSIATVSNGIVQRVSDGMVDFTASCVGSGRKITKTRKSIVGFPSVALSAQITHNFDFIVNASSSNDEIDQLITDAVEQGILRYKWGIQLQGSNTGIEWFESQYNNFPVSVPDSLDYVTIYLKWLDKHGNDSAPVSLQIFQPGEYYLNIDMLGVNPQTGITVVEAPQYSFPSITTLYGHPCMVFSAVPSSSLPPITSITIENETFYPSDNYNLPAYGSCANVYVFDILYTQVFQNIFYLDSVYMRFGVKTIDVYLNSNNGAFHCFNILCAKKIRVV